MTDVDWELLFRYRGGECSAEERARFERWLAADPAHRALLEATAIAGERLLARRPTPVPFARIIERDRRAAQWRRRGLAAAASIALLIGGGLTWRALGPEHGGAVRQAPMQVVSTGRGERATLRLADGTHVVLGAASTLRYPAAFAESRDVQLAGEAYFEVTHDARRPFRVHAGRAVAEDLGTAFVVRAYAGDTAVRVVVAEGLVALRGDSSVADAPRATGSGTVLAAGQLGRLAHGSTVAAVERVDVDAYLGLARGELVFDETPLPEVAAEVGRWYGVELRIADPALASRRLTGRFGAESLEEALAVMRATLDVRVERAGDTVVIRAAER